MARSKAVALRDRVVAFERVKAKDLQVHPHNWRMHPPAQSAALKGVLAEVGIAGALLAYRREGDAKLTLIDGHLRADSTPDQEWPVVIVDVTDAEADYLLATHDPLSAMARPDQDKLLDLLASVEPESQSVKDMLEALANGETQPLPDEVLVDVEPRIDEADELRKKWGVERGQAWTLGEHRLMCGDTTNAEDIAMLLGGAKASMMFTDPPYAIYGSATGVSGEIADDKMVRPFFRDILDVARDNTKPFAHVYICCDWRSWAAWWEVAKDARLAVKNCIVWDKISAGMGSMYRNRHEFLLFAVNHYVSTVHMSGQKSGQHIVTDENVWSIKRELTADKEHNAQKPVELVERAIQSSSVGSAIVLDPFVGSGTTIIAAEKLHRRCYAMEIAEKYVAVSLQRWADATGKTPVLDG